MLLGDLVSAFEEFTGPLPASIGCEVPLVVEGAAAGAEDSGGRGVIGWTVLLADAVCVRLRGWHWPVAVLKFDFRGHVIPSPFEPQSGGVIRY